MVITDYYSLRAPKLELSEFKSQITNLPSKDVVLIRVNLSPTGPALAMHVITLLCCVTSTSPSFFFS